MDAAQLRYQVTDHVATITFDRPGQLNAFTLRMAQELVAALDAADADDDVRAIVLTGAGRAFCAGADLSGGSTTFAQAGDGFDMAAHADPGGTLIRRMFVATKPLIAAINGPAVGIGASITLVADIRLMADDARIGFVFTRRGLVPESCSSWFLPRIVGISTALEWVISGQLVDAGEALAAGLVREVHPAAQLLDRAQDFAGELTARSAPVAVALARRMLWTMLGSADPADAHLMESQVLYALGRSADVAEGVQAFLDKRPANFPLRVSTDLPGFLLPRLAD